MADDISGRLGSAFADFEGIASNGRTGSHVHDHGDRVVVALVFENHTRGLAASLTTGYILQRMGNGARLDGRAPVSADAALACGCGTPDAAFYALSVQQAEVFHRVLRYATDMGYDPHGDRSADPVDPGSRTPLFVILGHAFETFHGCYESVRGLDASLPSLGVWSNVLRVFDDDVVDAPDLVRRAVVSRRTVRAVARDLERMGWLEVEKPARGKTAFRLTSEGCRARAAGARLVEAAQADFVSRFGSDRVPGLHGALARLVDQLDIELPWHLTGYGLADSSPTGGNHVPAPEGPARIPAHGADWPVVVKDPLADSSGQPLSALLSKALAAYRIDYEWDMRGHGTGLDFIANFLARVDDEGVDLKAASALAGVTGNGRSALERHLVVVVEPRRGRGSSRRVHLTPKGRQARDGHPGLVARLERDWHARYGACVDDLRSVLESLDEDFDTDLPNFPDPTDWLYRSMLAGSAAQRKRDASRPSHPTSA